MWKPAEAIAVTTDERSLLKQLLSDNSTPQNVAVRIRVVLGAAEGISNNELAERLSTSRMTVLKWRKRFVEYGIEGILADAPRSGRKKRIRVEVEDEAGLVEATLKTCPTNATHWYTRLRAATQKESGTTVHRTWRDRSLQLNRIEKFKTSQDPEFMPKLRDIVGLYRNPPEKVLVFSVDEKSQLQVSDGAQPVFPPREELPEDRPHNHRRYGTSTLLAGLGMLERTVTVHNSPRHRHQEFLKFLNGLDATVANGQQIHLVLDNYRAHKHPTLKAWIAARPNYHLHFTRTGSSWLNLIERFQPHIQRGTFPSGPAVMRAIADYIRDRNKGAKPFVWVASADHSIQRVR